MKPPSGGVLSDADILKLSKECLGDDGFMDKFRKAVGEEDIPDAAKDKEGHLAFIKRIQERLAEDALKEHTKEGKVFEDKDGQWTFTLPEPAFCIKATDQSRRKKIFINICRSAAIAEPMPMTPGEAADSGIQDEGLQFRVPISIGPSRVDSDKSGKPAIVYDIAVNPLTLSKADADPEFKRLLCALCLYGLAQKHEPELNTDEYKTPNLKVKGTPVVQRIRIQKKKSNIFNNEIALPGDEKRQQQQPAPDAAPQPKIQVVGEESEKADGPSPAKPGSGTDALWDSYTAAQKDLQADIEAALAEAKIAPPGSAPPQLAEDAAPKRRVDVDEEGEYNWSAHKCPAKNAYWQARARVPAALTVTAHLPEVQATIRECAVDVTPQRLRVCGVDDEDQSAPYVELEFKYPVDPDAVKARFVKKKQLLTLTVPVRLPDENVQERERKEAFQREEQAEREKKEREEAEEEKQRAELRAKYDRVKKDQEEQQTFNKSLVDAAKKINEGALPEELQKMVDDLPAEEARTLMSRLMDGKKRGDNVDDLLDKLPRPAIENMIDAIRAKLGLAKRPEVIEAEKRRKAVEQQQKEQKEKEDDPNWFGYGGDRAAEKLFGFKFRNRYLFGLDQ
eukprot:TRINITY_DN5253_c0_g1_i1.p1 TRINITY_DN5253_c0_g1~~TRINITY_DN5253_c0_g1_i1.p1  ORF type:complete len:620 (+),score=273.68 TRINITY_DN5253_c0_g1_i1:76-1935(+)